MHQLDELRSFLKPRLNDEGSDGVGCELLDKVDELKEEVEHLHDRVRSMLDMMLDMAREAKPDQQAEANRLAQGLRKIWKQRFKKQWEEVCQRSAIWAPHLPSAGISRRWRSAWKSSTPREQTTIEQA